MKPKRCATHHICPCWLDRITRAHRVMRDFWYESGAILQGFDPEDKIGYRNHIAFKKMLDELDDIFNPSKKLKKRE